MRYKTQFLQANSADFELLAADLDDALIQANPEWEVVSIMPMVKAGETSGLILTMWNPKQPAEE